MNVSLNIIKHRALAGQNSEFVTVNPKDLLNLVNEVELLQNFVDNIELNITFLKMNIIDNNKTQEENNDKKTNP